MTDVLAGRYGECAGCGATAAPGDPIRYEQDVWTHRVCPRPPVRRVTSSGKVPEGGKEQR